MSTAETSDRLRVSTTAATDTGFSDEGTAGILPHGWAEPGSLRRNLTVRQAFGVRERSGRWT